MRILLKNISYAAALFCLAAPLSGRAQGYRSDFWSFGGVDIFSRGLKKKVDKTWFSSGSSHTSHSVSFSYLFRANNQNGASKGNLPARFPCEFRTIDGKGNNVSRPDLGAAFTPMLRLFVDDYADGQSAPSGAGRPSARLISNTVCDQEVSILNDSGASDFLWQWGQFLDHDIDETPGADPLEAFDIEVPQGDPFFDPFNSGTQLIPLNRSGFIIDSSNVRQQVNAITSVIDASNVYGSEEDRAHALRTLDGTGKLKTSGPAEAAMLPFNIDGFPNAGGTGAELFFAGDVRANEQIGLTVMHTLFVREHNYWAEKIAEEHPYLNGDELYEKARVIVAAEMQSITYNEFLPLLLGRNALPKYRGYDSSIDPSISNLFATAAYRVGHTMLSPQIQRLKEDGQPIDQGHIALQNAFFRPDTIANGGGIDPLLRGLAAQPAQKIDTQIIDAVRNFLFGPPGAGGFDLASLNIQRGRDHGLPSYNEVRRHFGLSALNSFSEYHEIEPGLAGRLELLYDTPENMDAWVGLLGEGHVSGALVGETLRAVLVDQFKRLRDGDRFWYQNYLTPDFQKFIERQTLAAIITRNTGIRSIQADVFRLSGPGNHHCPVKVKPGEFKDHRNRHYFGPDSTFRRWKDFGFGEGHHLSAILKQVSPMVNGAFSVEITQNKSGGVKKSDIKVLNGAVSGISSPGNGHYFASIISNGVGPVSVSYGGAVVEPTQGTGSYNAGIAEQLPVARPETYCLDVSTEYPGEITFSSEFLSPVVFASIEKSNKKLPDLRVRVDDLTNKGATIHLERIDLQFKEVGAKVRVFVVEEGRYSVGTTGIQMEVGKAITRSEIDVELVQSHDEKSVVLTQVQTSNSPNSKYSQALLNGSNLKLQLKGEGRAEYETVGYAVIEARQGSFQGIPYVAGIQTVGKKGSAFIKLPFKVGENSAALVSPQDVDCFPAMRIPLSKRIEVYSQEGKLPRKSPVGFLIIGD